MSANRRQNKYVRGRVPHPLVVKVELKKPEFQLEFPLLAGFRPLVNISDEYEVEVFKISKFSDLLRPY